MTVSVGIGPRVGMASSGNRDGGRFLLWATVACLALALASATTVSLLRNPSASPGDVPLSIRVLRSINYGSPQWVAGLLAFPWFLWIARRFPVSRGSWGTSVAMTMTAALVAAFGLTVVIYRRTPEPLLQSMPFGWFASFTVPFRLMRFLAIAAVAHAIEQYARNRRSEMDVERMRRQLAEAKLEALMSQLRPHFLFNTLQGISTLMHRDVVAADAMLNRLGTLLRATLAYRDAEVPLATEVELATEYIEIARARFGDRLRFQADVDGEAHPALVPFFILQPLVENAIEHGIAPTSSGGSVTIHARRRGSTLVLQIIDDGGQGPGKSGTGIGLSNVRHRLEQLYGGDHSLSIDRDPARGTVVEVRIPFRLPDAGERPADDPMADGGE